MKKLLLLFSVIFISCNAIQKPLCEEPIYLEGQILLAKYTGHDTRIILYKTLSGNVVIHNVPMNVDSNKIPVCFKYDKFIYFKKEQNDKLYSEGKRGI